jgi:hypothetical protein
MASKGGGSGGGKVILIPLALLSAFLFCQSFNLLPTSVNDEIVRWASSCTFLVAAIVFGRDGSAVWCGLCAALAVVLNPVYPLDLGSYFFSAKLFGGAIAGAAVVRNW